MIPLVIICLLLLFGLFRVLFSKKKKTVSPFKIVNEFKPLSPPLKKEYRPRSMTKEEKRLYDIYPNLQFWYNNDITFCLVNYERRKQVLSKIGKYEN